MPAGEIHSFDYVITDGDGDTSQANLSFTFINEGDDPVVVEFVDSEGDVLYGTAASELLEGGDLNDTLIGGAGNDTLIGGGGDDSLTGGSGGDLFVISADDGEVIISDFDMAEDTIDLDALFDALAIDPADRNQGDAWNFEVASGVATLTLSVGNGPDVIFENITDPTAADLAQLAGRVSVSDES